MARIKELFSQFAERVLWFFYTRLQWRRQRSLVFELLWKSAARQSAHFIEQNFDDAVIYLERGHFWTYLMSRLRGEGALIEVGVWKGASINFIADFLIAHNDPRLVHGFDSFEGLQEDWSGEGLGKGFFDQHGKLPAVRRNVRLYKGWVQDTLAGAMAALDNPTVALVHIDTDTYSPAKYILDFVKPYLVEGSIIVFDELIGYPNWQIHEFKALQETLDRADYVYIGFTSRQAAIRMLRTPA